MKKEYIIWTLLAAIVIALGIIFRTDYFSHHSSDKSYYKKDVSRYFEGTNHDIIVYSLAVCDACKSTKSFLAKENILYHERPIEEMKYKNEYSSLQIPYTPLILLKPDLVIVGYQPDLILENITRDSYE